ncbi:MAG: iron-containing alcohol dehydrogenase, partial [Armatimonadetes bacterium]|nr:iron-containing alcohol dehydrogenase [Armatimonadota bacterium]
MISEFSFPTRIIVGPGAIRLLGQHIRQLGGARVQIVTDPGVVKAGLIDRLLVPLREENLESFVYDGVAPNPIEKNVTDGVNHYCEYNCDIIVGVGGGSSMDVAKAIRLKVTHDLPLSEYTTDKEGWNKIGQNIPPMLAVPTTSGTGSEVGRGAVVTMEATNRKALVFSPHLLATMAICDPELTLGLPPNITAWTGADA